MPDWTSSLNFPIFFYAALKNNTAPSQLDSVNILLLDHPYTGSDSSQKTLSPSIVSGYTTGSKTIAKDICLEYMELPEPERMQRLKRVGISNPTHAVNALVSLLNSGHIIIDEVSKSELLSLPYSEEPLLFLNAVLYESIKRNNNGMIRLSNRLREEIMSFRSFSSAINIDRQGRASIISKSKETPAETSSYIQNLPAYQNRPGKCIDDDNKNYYVLDDYDDNDYFSAAPSEYIANFLFFITLSSYEKSLNGEERRKNYLLLVHDRYMGGNDLWSVPFYSYSIQSNSGVSRPKTVKMIREYFKKHLSEMNREIQATTNQLIFHLNILSGYSLEEGDSYIEYKNSPSQPDRKKCYYVKEFFLKDVDPSEAINLVDPENLHGYRYFPLSEWEETDGGIPWFERREKQLKFPGGYIPENVAKNIFDQKKVRLHMIPVPNDSLFYTGPGFLFRIKVFNYTDAYELSYASRKEDLEYAIKDIFERVLLAGGINRFIIHEDTVTAWMPYTRTPGLLNPAYSIAESIQRQLCRISSFSETVPGTLCFIVYGDGDDIQFGKKYGLQQKTPCFFGSAIDRLTSLACSVINGFMYEDLNEDIQYAMGNSSTGIINKMKNLLSTDLYHPHYQKDIIFVSDEAINFDPDDKRHYQKVNFSSLPGKSSKRDYYMYYRV